MKHYPVMLAEVLDALALKDGAVYVDATFGNGGYTEAMLKAAKCKVIAIDRDPSVKAKADELKKKYGERFEFVAGKFGDLSSLVKEKIDGVVFDIGVSSMQLDEAERGFSFAKDAPLDMRMSSKGETAAEVVNNMGEKELADVIYEFGEEKKSRHIAAKIALYRKTKKIETTKELAEIIYTVIRKKFGEIDPATRTFQALRIYVNDELGELRRGLEGATSLLKPKGRLVVVDFHSLEDRIVKNFFNEKAGKEESVSRYMPEMKKTKDIIFNKISKAIKPSEKEIIENPRSRSAKLRYAVMSCVGDLK